MNPLPALVSNSPESGDGSAPPPLVAGQGIYSSANRRTSPSQQIYPWLLCASTALAAVFCMMYITKPVIVTSPGVSEISRLESKTPAKISPVATPQTHASLMPSGDRLPGEKDVIAASPRQALSPPQSGKIFEETNLRIQHILTAEAPGGHLARIDIDVPVLYQSRNLRWTPGEVAEARALLVRLGNYQEKSQILRAEGIELLDSWNRLIEHSIPNGELRADSPTLPVNQQDAADAPRPAGLNTSESIKIQPSGK
ncbi:MAG: hypothetical protein ABI162_10015 [Luteolibacter sp.]